VTFERTEPPHEGDERATLTGFLDYQRQTLEMKCDGLTDEQLRERTVPPSGLSLLGLVRHMADVERSSFRRVIADEEARNADVSEAFATWKEACEHSRRITAANDLGFVATTPDGTESFSVRWILSHMIEEYARHNGHADFLRERIDGAVGE
jgi:hypothetical protein